MLQIYLLALSGLVFAQATPGPNFLAVSGTALGQGRRAALMMTFGVASATFLWASAAALGLGALLALYPSLVTAMKLIGGGYLCFLGVKSLIAAMRKGEDMIVRKQLVLSDGDAWRRGFFVNMTNPKSALFWAALATWLFGSGMGTLQVWSFAPVGTLTALVIYCSYSLLFSSGVARSFLGRFSRAMNAAFGLCFGVLGGSLLVDGAKTVLR